MGGATEVAAAQGAAPDLDPLTLVSAGISAGSPQEAAQSAQAVAGYATATKAVDALHSMSWAAQKAAIKGYSPQQMGMLRSAGYKAPPTDDQVHSGFWGDIVHAGSDVVGGLVKGGEDVATGVKIGARDTLGVLGSGLRFTQHLFRAGHDISELGMHDSGESWNQIAHQTQGSGIFGSFLSSWHDLFNTHAWATAWDESTNGQTSFDPAIQRMVQSQYGPQVYKLASQLAKGTPAQTIVDSYHPNLRANIEQALRSKDVQTAATQLGNAHLSVGQSAVGERFLTDHPSLGHKLSGGVDLAYDILGDPSMKLGAVTGVGGKVAEGMYGLTAEKAGQLAAGDSSAYQAFIRSSPGIQKWIQTIGGKIESGGISAAERYDPRLLKYAQGFSEGGQSFSGLSEAGVHDASSLEKYLMSEAGKTAILTGRAATITHGGAIAPHLSSLGWAKMTAKGGLANTIDWAADTIKKEPEIPLAAEDLNMGSPAHAMSMDATGSLPQTLGDLTSETTPFEQSQGGQLSNLLIRPAGSAARMLRRMTTITADAPAVDVTAPDAAVNIKRVLSYFLPAHQTNQIVDAFLATRDVGQKFAIYRGGVDQMLHASGAFDTERGTAAANQILDMVDLHAKREAYAPGGYDKFTDGTRSAVLDSQMSNTLSLPSFKNIYNASRREKFYNRLGISNADTIDKMMEKWKAGVLMRPGFATRVSGDEVLSDILRNGVSPYLAARSAIHEATGDAAAEAKAKADADAASGDFDAIDHRVAHSLAAMASKLPSAIIRAAKSPLDLASAIVGHGTWLAYRGTRGALTREQYYNAAARILDKQSSASSVFGDDFASGARAGGGFDESADIRNMMIDGKVIPLKMKAGGAYSDVLQSDPNYRLRYHGALDTLGRSKLAQEVLKRIDRPVPEQTQAVHDLLTSPEMESTRTAAIRNFKLGDGRQVGVDATQDEAHREWAAKIVQMTNHLVRSAHPMDGPVLRDVVDTLVRTGYSPSLDDLEKIKNSDLPDTIFGPEWTPIEGVDRAIQWGFRGLSHIIDNFSRRPIFVHAYAQAEHDLAPWVRQMTGAGRTVEQTAPLNAQSPLEDISRAVSRHVQAIDPNARVEIEQRANDSVGKMLGHPEHTHIKVYSGDRFVGDLDYETRTGRIQGIGVQDAAKRQGYATAMWDAAREAHGIAPSRFPDPVHSDDLSPDAERWIPSLEGRARPVPQTTVGTGTFRDLTDAEKARQTEAHDRMLSDMATTRAFQAVKPFVHNPEVRSQFEVMHRTAFPFLFAQTQFVKRWARSFADNPQAIRKAQLGMNGLRVSGITHQDQYGNDVFTYPGSAFVTRLLGETLNALHISAAIPVGVPFTGEIKNFLPGLANPLSPSVGPGVAVPLKEVANFFPELQPTQQALLQEGASQTWWEQILPTTLTRLIQTVSGNAQTPTEFASSMMKAMQLASANGYGLPKTATPAQTQAYIDRIENWTRILFFTKAALGFVAPASPTMDFDPKDFNTRLQTLFSELPYDQAIETFLKENPKASAYTAFMSHSTGDVPNLASTAAAGQFIAQNRGFIKAFPQASGWFIPRTTGNGVFDPAVYRQQIQYAMRTEELPVQFLQDIQKAPAAQVYFQEEDNETTALANTSGSAQKAAIRNTVDQWKAKFLAQNPALAEYLSAGSKAPERASTLREVQAALQSPDLPQSAQTEHVRTMMQTFQNYEQAFLATDGNYSATALSEQSQLKTGFTNWATQYIAANPDVSDFYSLLIAPDLGANAIEQGIV
jgi:hypothetical protein